MDAWEEYIHTMNFVNITFTNNYLVDVQWGNNGFFIVEHFQVSCDHNDLFERYVIENNTVINTKDSLESRVYFTFSASEIGTNEVIIKNNSFTNIIYKEKQFFEIVKPNLLSMNVTFINLYLESIYNIDNPTNLINIKADYV